MGGVIHRGGCAEAILLLANHRHLLAGPGDWSGATARLRRHAPEKKAVVETDTPDEALVALRVAPDVLQLNRLTPE